MPLVLIVDDTVDNLKLAAFLLKGAGYQVETAVTAYEGIAKARDLHPTLILMDIGLPGMDGLEATRALKADPTTSSVPVVALTAHAMKGDRERCLEAGCTGYIAKPYDTKVFARTVSSYLPTP
jgi:CheY-like chemotaxis protein